jgi:hypothetical protein
MARMFGAGATKVCDDGGLRSLGRAMSFNCGPETMTRTPAVGSVPYPPRRDKRTLACYEHKTNKYGVCCARDEAIPVP